MRIPYFIQGALFGPALICLSLVLKVVCPAPVGAGCFTDHLAIPIFMPLAFIYRILDGNFLLGYELLFVIIYWSLVGLLIGLIFDLRTGKNEVQMTNVEGQIKSKI